jgi:hypothetical protein
MPQGTPIKDFRGRIRGYLDTKPNGDVWAYDFYGRLLGKYIKSMDQTRNFYGQVVAKGNAIASFIDLSDSNN